MDNLDNNQLFKNNNKPEFIKINELLNKSNLRPLDKPMGILTDKRFE